MNSNSKFLDLIALIKAGEIKVEGNHLSVELSDSGNFETIKSLLISIGYVFDELKTIRNRTINLRLTAQAWTTIECPFYIDWSALHQKVSVSSTVPELFFVISDLCSNADNKNNNTKRLRLFCELRSLLAQMSDHCEPNSGVAIGKDKLLFLIETDTNISKHVFSPNINWESLSTISGPDQALDSIVKLNKALNVDDSQDAERRSVMRSAFNELINSCVDAKSIFPTVLNAIEKLQVKYDEHHELFIKRFSVNKVLQEINQQDLQYTSKINEIISSGQTKALAIPGALIAIGAIMKIDHVYDGVAVGAGLYITSSIVSKSLDVHSETFRHIKKQVEEEFERYNSLSEKAEVRKQSVRIKKELLALVEKASNNLSFIKSRINFTLAAAIIYISFSLFNSSNVFSKDFVFERVGDLKHMEDVNKYVKIYVNNNCPVGRFDNKLQLCEKL